MNFNYEQVSLGVSCTVGVTCGHCHSVSWLPSVHHDEYSYSF